MTNTLNAELLAKLNEKGIELFYQVEAKMISENVYFEPPCSIKWIDIFGDFYIGAFSYAVSGFFSEVKIGRYCSIGENVQIGRSDHPLDFLSTSPIFHTRNKIFNIGFDFIESNYFHEYEVELPPDGVLLGKPRLTEIGNDVWIGHGAYIRSGVRVGDGAVIGAHAVVTKDVPPYSVVVGNPGRIVKMRFDDSIIQKLLDTKWWNFAPWDLKNIKYFDFINSLDKLSNFELDKSYKPNLISIFAGEIVENKSIDINEIFTFQSFYPQMVCK